MDIAPSPLPPTSQPTLPKAIIFDLLTALLDSWTVWNESTASHTAEEGHRWRKRYLELTYGCGAYRPYEDLVLQAAREAGLPDPEEAAARLRENWDSIKPWPEAPSVLARLREKGYALGVVTNCSNELGMRAVKWCEAAVGRDGHGREFAFDAVITAEESGCYKPDPKPYLDLLQKMGVRPEEALFVAGSASDVPGAMGVGMRVVWHNKVGLARKGDVQAWREGTTLDDVLEVVL